MSDPDDREKLYADLRDRLGKLVRMQDVIRTDGDKMPTLFREQVMTSMARGTKAILGELRRYGQQEGWTHIVGDIACGCEQCITIQIDRVDSLLAAGLSCDCDSCRKSKGPTDEARRRGIEKVNLACVPDCMSEADQLDVMTPAEKLELIEARRQEDKS